MTNSEAIKQLKERYDIGQKEYLNFAPKYIESLKMAMESLEENDKLKAEIEQLKLYAGEIINARNLSEETAVSIQARMQREMILQRENERLKERLEIKDNNFELYSNALEEIEQLVELMPKICETCEYEDEIGWKEPCNSCKNGNNWKLKSEVSE